MTRQVTQAELRELFRQTLSHDSQIRVAAEKNLVVAKTIPGHSLEVLKLVASSGATDVSVCQSAAVHFKNIAKNEWDETKEDRNAAIVISVDERNTIKSHLVQLMCTSPPQIQAQISEAISLIAQVDYPEKWNNLLPELVQQFHSTDPAVVCGVLKTANSIFKRFRYVQRSDELYKVIIYTLQGIQAPLLTLFRATGTAVEACTNDAVQLKLRFDALYSICRIFFSLNYQDMPEYFEDHMGEWMEDFAKYLQYQNPLLTDDSEEEEPSPIDRLQYAIVENLSLYAGKDEEVFVEQHLNQFTSLVWNLLLRLTSFPKHDTLATTSIRFLSSLVEKAMHKALFQEDATLREIVGRIVVANLTLREVDQEGFEDDPAEFIRIEMEGNDSFSRRRCSQDLLRAMCRHFEEPTTVVCSELVQSMLATYIADPSKQWVAKDTAIHLMMGISIRRESRNGVSEVNSAVNVMDFFNAHILPELQDSNHANRPMMKATAIKFVTTFRLQFSREQLVALMPLLIEHLGSPNIVVHTYAAHAIERILVSRDEGAAGAKKPRIGAVELQPVLEPLFTALFRIVDNSELNENEHVMRCAMRTLVVAEDSIVAVTEIVIRKLVDALARVVVNPRNPQFNHNLFESIAVLVRAVCRKDASATGPLEALLFPPFEVILQKEVVEFVPYVFQVLAQLLEYRSGLSDAFEGLLPPLLTPTLWLQTGNVPALSRLLRAYIRKAPAMIVNQGHLMAILGIFQQLLSRRSNEPDAFQLLSYMVTYVPQESMRPNFNAIFKLLCTKLQQGKTARYVRLLTTFLALFIGKYGSQAYFDELNAIQAGLALMILVQVWKPMLVNDPPARTDAKVQSIGLTRLLCENTGLLDDANGQKIWSETLAGLVKILTSSLSALERGDDDAEPELEIGFGSTYSGLAFAREFVTDPFPEVTDPVGNFMRSLHALSTSHPGRLPPIIHQGLSSDNKLLAGFEAMLKQTGLSLV